MTPYRGQPEPEDVCRTFLPCGPARVAGDSDIRFNGSKGAGGVLTGAACAAR